jgi:cytochrome oxidase Cu insertion factor (SCO1/SenC/PrrC family)
MSFARKVFPSIWLFLIVGVALLPVFTGGTATGQPAEPPMGLAEVKPAVPMPTFTLPDVNGAVFDASTLQGKVVVVRFWATW